ncbi:hypothetical protein HPB48_003616 [Haemaphysalis longicornis]|uniref:Uncharacterized protein n=1 Tax=Haemaphysalis longicornis TaxID=44386 RepID=A0A9J6FGS1_HAELO|nr:hypothetical protein HPB48_003616 [Haemaphysalis longicornis]
MSRGPGCAVMKPQHQHRTLQGNSVQGRRRGKGRDRQICKFYAAQGFCRQGDRCACSHVSSDTGRLSEPVIDPVRPLRPPEVGSSVLGQVSAVLSPSCFYLVFPYGRRSIERLRTEGMGSNSGETLETLTENLQDACSYEEAFREDRNVAKALGELVAAKSNLNQRWYRARVVSLEEGDSLKVFYMDFGFCESVSVNHVRPLEERFTQLPQQALQACLVTDQFSNRLGNEPIWDTHYSEAFTKCVYGKDLVVKIVCVAQGLLHVRLFFMEDGVPQLRSVCSCLREARINEQK